MQSDEHESKILIEIAENFKGLKINRRKIKALVMAIAGRFSMSEGQISIAIVDDEQIVKVNEQFLNHDYVTDVISFDLSDADGQAQFELVVNGQMAQRQSQERGHEPTTELALYITHGLLHNLGFDDSDAAHAKQMHRMEDEILMSLGYGRVYGSK
jgi:probable rRNA maturation factor